MTAKDADKPATGKPSWLARLAQRRWVTCLEVLLALPMLLSDLFACKWLRAPATIKHEGFGENPRSPWRSFIAPSMSAPPRPLCGSTTAPRGPSADR